MPSANFAPAMQCYQSSLVFPCSAQCMIRSRHFQCKSMHTSLREFSEVLSIAAVPDVSHSLDAEVTHTCTKAWQSISLLVCKQSWAAGSHEATLTMASLFSWRALSLHRFSGWLIALANVLNALFASGFLMLVVSPLPAPSPPPPPPPSSFPPCWSK